MIVPDRIAHECWDDVCDFPLPLPARRHFPYVVSRRHLQFQSFSLPLNISLGGEDLALKISLDVRAFQTLESRK
jgi:hypothetical protein